MSRRGLRAALLRRSRGAPCSSASRIRSQRDEFTGEELYTLRARAVLPAAARAHGRRAGGAADRASTCSRASSPTPSRCASRSRTWPSAGPARRRTPSRGSGARRGSWLPLYSAEIAARLAKLENAISKQRTVGSRYCTIGRDSEAERTVNPYGLLRGLRHLVRVGDDHDRDAIGGVPSASRGSAATSASPPARERDFRCRRTSTPPHYRDRPDWQSRRRRSARRCIEVDADTAWLVERLVGARGVRGARRLGPLHHRATRTSASSRAWILRQAGRARPLGPPETSSRLVARATRQTVIETHSGEPRAAATRSPRGREGEAPEPPTGRTRGRSRRSASRVLQALLAFLLARLRQRGLRAGRRRTSSCDRFRLTAGGAAGAASTCSTSSTSAAAATRSTRPLEDGRRSTSRRSSTATRSGARRGSRRSRRRRSCWRSTSSGRWSPPRPTRRSSGARKVEAAFGTYALADTPEAAGDRRRGARRRDYLNAGVRDRKLVDITYLSRSSNEFSTRSVEPYLLRRDDRGWRTCADLGRESRRAAHVQGALHQGGTALAGTTCPGPRWPTSTTRSAARWASPGSGSRPSARAGSSRGAPGPSPPAAEPPSPT